MTETEYYAQIEKIRERAHERRSTAWAAVPERVLGLALSPITPATFALLVGTQNAFVCGLHPCERDVRNWILYHSPEFDSDDPQPRFLSRLRLALRTERALLPLFTGWRLHGRKRQQKRAGVRALNLLRAMREITEIVRDAFADGLPADTDPTPAVAASMTAQLTDLFARDYAFWPMPQPIRHTPIKQLYQLARCHDRAMHAKGGYFDREEAQLTAAFLEELNREAMARDRNSTLKPNV